MTLRYAYYGDDFTGSTDVLEQLAEGGVQAVLFLRPPDADLRARFPDVDAIGLAGDSRSRSPLWMDENLPAVFDVLSEADIVHYKTCSTFDSSPETGSIGKALEIGIGRFGAPAAIVVGAPHVGRYVAFGNLFASAGDDVYRIDRHPTMSRHPVTPMHEADLVRHLGKQTKLEISHVSLEQLRADEAGEAFNAAKQVSDAVLFDGVSLEDLGATGSVLLEHKLPLAVGSSGVTRALVIAWQKNGLIDSVIAPSSVGEVERLLVISGSCSPVTTSQVVKAAAHGYETHLVDMPALLRGESTEEQRLIDAALASLSSGRCCVSHSAEGPLKENETPAGDQLGVVLGRVTKAVIRRAGLRRIVFAGGDTSSHGVAQLGVDALTWAAPIEAGAPLVKTHSEDPSVDGLEMVLKGGQMGGENFFESVRRGA
jgi:uncharacterized protein YgbK (DUF1537 family)